jgi:hypothetical protein
VASDVFPYPIGPVINVVPGPCTFTDSTSDERDRKLAGKSGGSVLERVTPSRIGCGELSPALFFVATPKGDVKRGVRKGQGECFRGETRVI